MAGADLRLEYHCHGNQVSLQNPPGKSSKAAPRTLSAPALDPPEFALNGARADSAPQPLVTVLLDLSGDRCATALWARDHLTPGPLLIVDKAELKWQSKRAALRYIRSLRPRTFAFFATDLQAQSARGAMMLFAALCGASRIVFADTNGRQIRRSRPAALIIDGARLALELALGYAILIPLSWALTTCLKAALLVRPVIRATRQGPPAFAVPAKVAPGASADATHRRSAARPAAQSPRSFFADGGSQNQPRLRSTALYVRATLVPVMRGVSPGGGMASHVAGFNNGTLSLGHHLRFIASGPLDLQPGSEIDIIEPSPMLSATRAMFELWNNLVFTAGAVKRVRGRHHDASFIYQRYSRFNWTGVALSLITGLPLALEFNGSEVWAAKHWDPVGCIGLLRRFENLNLCAADAIFVVSDAQQPGLVAEGVDARRIVVNPNGVNTEVFHPDCGGRDLRRELGLEDRIVIGFTGTFGPWHGAPVLAEAATRVGDPRCHFLFIGDGDQRGVTEDVLRRAAGTERATFVGRIPHTRIAAYLDACDILVSPHIRSTDGTEFFGSPTKLFEYMAMARPVIASRLGQIVEVISDGKDGLLVEPGDAAALARAIEKLAKDEGMRERLGAAARETVARRHTWVRNAARVFDSLERLCRKAHSENEDVIR